MEIINLIGIWKIEKAIVGGDELLEEASLIFSDNKFERRTPDTVWKRNFQLIDCRGKFQGIDIYPQTEPYKGQLLKGIIKLENEKLYICHSEPDKVRPVAFESPKNTKSVVSISVKQ